MKAALLILLSAFAGTEARYISANGCRVFVDFVYFNLTDLQRQG
jgi:hypothetical protein